MRDVVTHPLPDGSTCVIEPITAKSSIVNRLVDGECVWAQAFAKGGDPDEHVDQLSEVVDKMRAAPGKFTRWWSR